MEQMQHNLLLRRFVERDIEALVRAAAACEERQPAVEPAQSPNGDTGYFVSAISIAMPAIAPG